MSASVPAPEARLQAWLDRMNATPHHSRCETNHRGECDCYRQRPEYLAAALLEQQRALRDALREYGAHKANCAANYSARPTMVDCDCGLARALGGAS